MTHPDAQLRPTVEGGEERVLSTELEERAAVLVGVALLHHSAETLHHTWQPFLEDDGSGYGVGWAITEYEGVEIIWHDGAYDTFTSIIGFIPEANVGFVLLINTEESGELLEETPYLLVDLLLRPAQ